MYWFYRVFIQFFLLSNILCHVDENYIQKQNDMLRKFFSICVVFILIGFVIGPISLIMILPFIVDSIDNDEFVNLHDENQVEEQKSKNETDNSTSITDDEEDDDNNEQDIEETSSF